MSGTSLLLHPMTPFQVAFICTRDDAPHGFICNSPLAPFSSSRLPVTQGRSKGGHRCLLIQTLLCIADTYSGLAAWDHLSAFATYRLGLLRTALVRVVLCLRPAPVCSPLKGLSPTRLMYCTASYSYHHLNAIRLYTPIALLIGDYAWSGNFLGL